MRIIKRSKGRRLYYYLQHSYRENKKVITKELYLGKTIPKDIYEIIGRLRNEAKKDLYIKLEEIKKSFQREYNKFPKSIKDKEKKQIAIVFTYNTNAIEGSTITLAETREIIEKNIAPNKSLSDIKETELHSKVFLDMLNKKEKISINLLLKWHYNLFNETKQDISGKFRDYSVRVGNYIAPDWQEVNRLMNKLINFINKSKLNAVELAAISHFRFESIHPFGDGNGRVGRLLMNHILWYNKYPILIIENKKRMQYYKALQEGEEAFLKHFLRLYLKVNKKRL
mgnify:FL=1